jgi:hypothetical protein
MAVMVREAWTDERLDELNKKVDDGFARVDADIRELRVEIADMRKENQREFLKLRNEIKSEGAALRAEIKGEGCSLRGEMRDLRDEMNARFNALEARFDTMNRNFIGLLIAIVAAIVGSNVF